MNQNIYDKLDKLNNDLSHFTSRDDICTPMNCVKTMIDYIPKTVWTLPNLKVLDPCSGNGNFGAYALSKTGKQNVFFNELNKKRIANSKAILGKDINITNKDALTLKGEYDVVMANPPYKGKGNKNRGIMKEFIEQGIDLLKDGGYLCYITPNSWMSYNNDNITLKRLLNEGSFLTIDNTAKKFFKGVGSSFTIFVWQKGVFDNKTTVYNKFLKEDIQEVVIPKDIPYIPLYISQTVLDIIPTMIDRDNSGMRYRCDLHNYTQAAKLNDKQTDVFKYETIHTVRKTRYASVKQDIYSKWKIIIPLSTYFVPYITKNTNVTQSVAYIPFDTKKEAQVFMKHLQQPIIKLFIHITRYGNFNNLRLIKDIKICDYPESKEVSELVKLIKY